MAIKISGTTVIDDSQNITNVGIVTATSFTGDGSQLTNLPGGGGNTLEATASGTLEDGSKVIVNADGTVSVVTQTETTGAGTGSAETFSSLSINNNSGTAAVYDSTNNRVIVAFVHNSGGWKARVAVGTVSGTSISFGSAVTFVNEYVTKMDMAYGNGKVVITYAYNGVYGTAIVGTVSGTSISFGSANTFYNNNIGATSVVYDPDTDRFVIMYSAAGNTWGLVATVSGTSISYGSATSAESSEAYATSSVYDISNNKVVIAYIKNAPVVDPEARRTYSRVATISGTSISFGPAAALNGTSQTRYLDLAFDSSANKVVAAYKHYSGVAGTHYGYVQVGTVSGTSISFGSQVAFESAEIGELSATFDSTNNKVVIAFANASLHGKVITGTVSGTSINFDTATTFHAAQTNHPSIVFDSNSGKAVAAYKNGNGDIGDAIVFAASGLPVPEIGSEVVFESAAIRHVSSTFDSTNNKVVIAYRDDGNSFYGTAVVGTVSGTSISFGTPVVFESATTQHTSVAYDSSNQKVVIVYTDNGNSNYGTAVVGEIDGTTINFGSPVVFRSAYCGYNSAVYDASAQKVVVAYQDGGNSDRGYTSVLTVSGNSVTYGSNRQFESGRVDAIGTAYDSTNQKVVIAYQDGGSSSYGKAVVATISGTENTFGTPVTFESAGTHDISAAYDSSNQKVVIAYKDQGNSWAGTAIVGTVSGTSISFGSPVVYASSPGSLTNNAVVYNSSEQKVVIAYEDAGNSGYGTAVVGTVSGTSISFGSPSVFNTATTYYNSPTYDSTNNKVVIPYKDQGNSGYGTAVTFSPRTISRNLTSENYIGISDGAYSDGQTSTIQLTGAVDDAQSSLTPGQAYYVQNDGTLSETADNPSVFAGTALASTKLIVRG